MNMIYEKRRRSASNDPYVHAFLPLLCFVCFNLCFCSFFNICLYCNNTEEPYREQRRILFGVLGSNRLTGSLVIFFDNILGRFDVVLKSEGVRGGCNTPTISILPFGTQLNKYSTKTKFCRIKIFEKYALGSFIFGRFTTTVCNLAANELLKNNLAYLLSYLVSYLFACSLKLNDS